MICSCRICIACACVTPPIVVPCTTARDASTAGGGTSSGATASSGATTTGATTSSGGFSTGATIGGTTTGGTTDNKVVGRVVDPFFFFCPFCDTFLCSLPRCLFRSSYTCVKKLLREKCIVLKHDATVCFKIILRLSHT